MPSTTQNMPSAPEHKTPNQHRPLKATRWYLIAAAAILIFVGAYVFLVSTEFGQKIENAAFEGAQDASIRVVSDVDRVLNAITVTSLAIAIIVIGIIGLVRKLWRLTIVAMAVVGVAVVSAELLKRVILHRPELLDVSEPLLHNSFPSGHTTIAMSILIAVFLVVPYRFRGLAIAIVMSWSVIIGPFTMIDRWHRLSDTIGGMCLALLMGAIAAIILHHWGMIRREPKVYWGRVVVYLVATAIAVAALIAGCLIAIPQFDQNLNLTHVQDTIFVGLVLLSLSFGIISGLLYWASWHHLDVAVKAKAAPRASGLPK